MPHRYPNDLRGLSEDVDLSTVEEEAWCNKFTQLQENGMMSTEAEMYMEFTEEYYSAKNRVRDKQ